MLSHALPQRYQPTSGRYTLGERDVNERSHRCTAQILKSDGKVSCSQTFLPWGTSHHVLLKMVTFSFLFFLTRVFTIVMRKLQLHHDSHESINILSIFLRDLTSEDSWKVPRFTLRGHVELWDMQHKFSSLYKGGFSVRWRVSMKFFTQVARIKRSTPWSKSMRRARRGRIIN